MAGAGAQGKTSWMTTAIVVVLLSLVGAGAGKIKVGTATNARHLPFC